MKEDKDILSRLNHKDGMTVPDGWFDDFASRMADSLPARPELENASPKAPLNRTVWERIRPYVYMAAMFAGVWCMLKMFTMITSNSSTSLEVNSVLAEAFNNETFVNDYILDDVNQWDVFDDMMEEGIDVYEIVDSLDVDTIAE